MIARPCRALAWPLLIALCAIAGPRRAVAQGGVGGRSEVFAGSELEGYLRYLQSLGIVASDPWAVRALSPRQLDRILPADSTRHPWQQRYALRRAEAGAGASVDYVRPTVTTRFNSTFPFGGNDGPIWAGRGLTTAVQGGVAARWRGLSVVVAPVAFRAENGGFELRPNGTAGPVAFNDLQFADLVDLPRRFGDGAYAAADPGQSTVRAEGWGLDVGASTANQVWGPGDRYPIILSNNAAGFPHVFAGTSGPLDLRVVKVQARVLYGRLSQSDYSPVRGSPTFVDVGQPGRRRFASGIVAVVQPRGLPGLEIGGARFFHSPWPAGGPTSRDYRKPFEVFYKEGVPRNEANPGDPLTDFDNQLASAFVRWVLPRSGFELFGEFYKEDHNYDARDLLLEPDHNAGYLLGARKAFRRADGSLLGLRWELVNLELGPLAQRRAQGRAYAGAYLRQGHTERGQLLGANVGVGSPAGSTAGVDWYTSSGRWSGSWSRTLRQDRLGRGDATPAAQAELADAYDVQHALGVERVWFRGPLDLSAGLVGVLNLNREFTHDAFNASATIGVRYNLR